MVHVPYKGAGQAITDLIGGQVQCFFASASSIMPHVQGGRVRALAVSTPDAVVQRLADDINRIIVEPQVRARLEAESSAVAPLSPARFERFVRDEITKYAPLVEAGGARLA